MVILQPHHFLSIEWREIASECTIKGSHRCGSTGANRGPGSNNTPQTVEEKERKQLLADKDNTLLFWAHWRSVWAYCMMLDHPRMYGWEQRCLLITWTHASPVWGLWTVRLEMTSVYLYLWTNMLVRMQAESSPSQPLLAWLGRTLPFSHVFFMPTQKEGCDHRAALASTSSHQRQICLGLHNNCSHGKMLSGSSVLNTRWLWPCYFPCHSIYVWTHTPKHVPHTCIETGLPTVKVQREIYGLSQSFSLFLVLIWLNCGVLFKKCFTEFTPLHSQLT